MERTKSIFQEVFRLPIVEKKPGFGWKGWLFNNALCHWWTQDTLSYNLTFVAVEAGIEDQTVLQLRKDKEQKALRDYHWDSLYDLHTFLFTQHTAYATVRLTKEYESKVPVISEALLKSY